MFSDQGCGTLRSGGTFKPADKFFRYFFKNNGPDTKVGHTEKQRQRTDTLNKFWLAENCPSHVM